MTAKTRRKETGKGGAPHRRSGETDMTASNGNGSAGKGRCGRGPAAWAAALALAMAVALLLTMQPSPAQAQVEPTRPMRCNIADGTLVYIKSLSSTATTVTVDYYSATDSELISSGTTLAVQICSATEDLHRTGHHVGISSLGDDTITGLTPATDYWVIVSSKGQSGKWRYIRTKAAGTTVPPPPPTLTATPGNTEAELTWMSGGDGGSAITSWQFHQGTSSSATAPTTGWATIAGSGASTTSHTITGLTNNVQLFFRVRAVNGEGNGAASAEKSATPAPLPAAPIGFSANERDSSVILDWVPGGDGGSTILRWEYRYSTDGGNSWDRWTEIPNSAPGGTNARNYTVTGLENGTQYRIEVRARNSTGPGPASAQRRFTPPGWPPAPTSLTATAGNRQVSLAWTPGGHSGWPITIWEYHQATSSSTNPPTTGWKWISGSGPGESMRAATR